MKKYRLMIVEDEEKSRKLLSFLITELNIGFDVMAEASNGVEALEFLHSLSEESLPDIILSDIRMPLMDGLSMVEKIRQDYKDMQVIIISAYDDFEYARTAIKLGVKDYILKPFNRADIRGPLENIYSELVSKEKFVDVSVFGQIKDYIDSNITDPDLSLTKIADALHLNTSYISRAFKEKAGINFSDYLVKARIEKAVLYLENTDLHSYEICEKVGIEDPKYFGRCLKKVTGMSSKEIRQGKKEYCLD